MGGWRGLGWGGVGVGWVGVHSAFQDKHVSWEGKGASKGNSVILFPLKYPQKGTNSKAQGHLFSGLLMSVVLALGGRVISLALFDNICKGSH